MCWLQESGLDLGTFTHSNCTEGKLRSSLGVSMSPDLVPKNTVSTGQFLSLGLLIGYEHREVEALFLHTCF